MMILIVTDAWHPQVNGVVRTLDTVGQELRAMGHQVEIVGPDRFSTVPLPTYPEIRLAVNPRPVLRRLLDALAPDAVHIATEGPLGLAARGLCLERGMAFTTAYHTRFPEYLRDRAPVPLGLTYALIRRFHAPAQAVMVATAAMEATLTARGFRNLRRWSRGVDTALFRPRTTGLYDHLPRPIFAHVGRIAVEKNVEAFLRLALPGTKVLVGDGPQRAELESRHPDAVFLGPRYGDDLATHYAAADVLVFPSRTDTFGLVMLEAMASGVPVAAFPVPGPLDVIGGSAAGVMDDDLRAACLAALDIPRALCRDHALGFSWRASAEQFLANLSPLPRTVAA